MTETMVTRALASEIRHASSALTALLERKIGLKKGELGSVSNVHCEADEQIDIVTTYSTNMRVGIEAKLDHEISDRQLAREASVVDHLILLVLESADAASHENQVGAVVTWTEILGCFTDSRLTLEDISRIPVTKKMVERRLFQLDTQSKLPPGWECTIRRGGGGMPAVVIEGPELASGRSLRGQIQVTGRNSKLGLDEVTFEYHVGVSVDLSEQDFPSNPENRPSWIDQLDELLKILNSKPGSFKVRTTMPRNGRSELGARKMPIVREHLKGQEWLAHGYCDWALGVKSEMKPITELPNLTQEAIELFTTWQNHLQKTDN
jgi:hypothetical protein